MPFNIVSKKVLPAIPETARANVVSNLQQGNQAGLCVGEGHVTLEVYNGGTITHNYTTCDIRIVAPRFFPSLGGLTNTRAISQSLDMLYNAVVGSAYDTTNFGRADLGKHLFITEGFVLGMDMIDRFLDTYAIRQYGNLAPDWLLKAQGFSATHGGQPVPYLELQALRNQLVPLFDKLLIPSSIAWINKHRSLVRHVFADDVHTKTQLIVPIPELLYWNLDDNSNISPVSDSIWSSNPHNLNDIMVFAAALITAVQNYLDSAWFKDLSPYLWRSMCQENGPKIDKIISFTERLDKVPLLKCDFIFDYSVIQLIRNADYVGKIANTNAGKTSTLAEFGMKIYEDNEGNLRQGKYAYGPGASDSTYGMMLQPLVLMYDANETNAYNPDELGTIDLINSTKIKVMIHPGARGKKYVNAEDYPSSDETLYYVMNASVDLEYRSYPGASKNRLFCIASSGDTVFTLINVIYNTTDYATSYADAVYPVDTSYLTDIVSDTDQAFAVKITRYALNVEYSSGTSNKSIIGTLESLNCCPLITRIMYNTDAELEFKTVYVDKDNLVYVPQQALVTIHQFISYHLMDLTNITRTTADAAHSSNSNNNRRNNKKNKSKDKDKNKDKDKDKKSPEDK